MCSTVVVVNHDELERLGPQELVELPVHDDRAVLHPAELGIVGAAHNVRRAVWGTKRKKERKKERKNVTERGKDLSASF